MKEIFEKVQDHRWLSLEDLMQVNRGLEATKHQPTVEVEWDVLASLLQMAIDCLHMRDGLIAKAKDGR